MKRKEFVKTSCSICLGALAGVSVLSLMESCATGKIIKIEPLNNVLSVMKSEFTPEQNFVLLRTSNLNFDVLLYKKSETEYKALLMQCTHYDNPVFANKKEIFCPSHGSTFSFEGKVQKEPARRDLKSYKTEILNDKININLE
jgi:Rieske Fe-S protein